METLSIFFIFYFSSFLGAVQYEKFSIQQELQLDNLGRNPEHWPLDHHHSPEKKPRIKAQDVTANITFGHATPLKIKPSKAQNEVQGTASP